MPCDGGCKGARGRDLRARRPRREAAREARQAALALRAGGGSRITISIETAPQRAVVRVSDDGPALDPSMASAIFTPLVSTKQAGLGLGLPIARALARAMRGELTLEQRSHNGFRLELPLVEPT